MENQMLCYQCESTADGKYCNGTAGVCGKTASVSYLQDSLTGALIGLAKASVHKSIDEEIQWLTVEGLCATAAHTNFDEDRLRAIIDKVQTAKMRYVPKFGDHNTSIKIPEDFDIRLIWQKSPDIRSLKSLLLFGIRGIATYAYQSWVLGYKNKEAATFFHKALIAISANHFKEDYFDLVNEMGDVNLRAMELLTKANHETYGQPSPAEVPRVIDPGPFIVVSGHNYKDLETILDQTADTGINVYSHCEMLPAHGYPKFKKYPHFKGHYGTGWQNQQAEFDSIPAAIVFTTNCIMMPLPSYADRVFTTGATGLPGIPHIEDNDFRPVLIRAIELNGAPAKITFPGTNGGDTVKTGFGKKSLQTLGYKVAGAMADNDINHIFVIGGCDGFGEDRQFFTDMLRRIPADSVVLTYGCCKFRFNDMENNETGGVPRIVDAGQCGDLLNIVEAVEAIAAAAQCRVEELPLTWLLSWQEQRSIANLFSLFASDVQNVIFGPKRPPFFTPKVFDIYAKEFNVSTLIRDEQEEAEEEPATERETATAADTEPVAPNRDQAAAFVKEEPVYEEEIASKEAATVTEAYTESPNNEEPTEEATAAPFTELVEEQVQEEDVASSHTPEKPEDRADAAGLPDWAISDEEEDAEESEEEAENAALVEKPRIRPEDIDQTPAFLLEEDTDQTEEAKTEDEEPSLFAESAEESAAQKEKEAAKTRKKTKSAKAKKKTAAQKETPPKAVKDRDTKATVTVKEEEEEETTAKAEDQNEAAAAQTIDLGIPKGKGVSGWKDPDENPAFDRTAPNKPYQYAPPRELKEIPSPPPIPLPEGAGVSGFAQKQPKESSPSPAEDMYSFAEPKPEIKIPKGKGVSGWKETDEVSFSVKNRKSDDEKSSAKPWLENSLKELKASLNEDNESPANTASTATESAVSTVEAPQAETVAPAAVEAAPTVQEAEIPAEPLLSEEERGAKPWLENSLQELKASVAEDEAAKKDAGSKPWLAASLQQLKESLKEEGIESVSDQTAEAPDATVTAPEQAEVPVETRHKPPVQPKSWQDIVPAAQPAANNASPATAKQEIVGEPSGDEPAPQTWQKPAVQPKPWDRDLQTTWHKPPVAPKPWEQQQPATFHEGNRAAPAQNDMELPNLPLGNRPDTSGRRPQPPPTPVEPSPYRYVELRETPPEIPPGSGVSGYMPPSYVPGQAPPQGYANNAPPELREIQQPPPMEIPLGKGVSGVHFHEDETPMVPSYDPTYYDVPQKTPKINLPKGIGVSGWQDGEGPMDPAEALRRQAAEKKSLTTDDLLAFTNAESPANVRKETVYRPGENEELIATLGPDGKVILAVRNKNNNR